MQQFAETSEQAAKRFHFDAIVRGLCECAKMTEHVQGTTAAAREKQKHAAAAIETAVQSLQLPLYNVTNTVR